MNTKETLEVLNETKTNPNKHISQWGEAELTINPNLENALSTAIGWGEMLEESKKVLPDELKRLIPTNPNFSLEIDNLQIAHNKLINLIRPILAKALLRIKELEKGGWEVLNQKSKLEEKIEASEKK